MHYALHTCSSKDKEAASIRAIYAREPSIKAVLCYQGPYCDQPYTGLDHEQDAELIESISWHYQQLSQPDSNH